MRHLGDKAFRGFARVSIAQAVDGLAALAARKRVGQ
jgi:hypothetical protein